MGAKEVTVIYHRYIDTMSALRAEYDDAVAEGVKFLWNTTVVAVKGGEGRHLQSITVESDGKRHEMPVDRLIGTLDEETIAEKTELPLKTVLELKKKAESIPTA